MIVCKDQLVQGKDPLHSIIVDFDPLKDRNKEISFQDLTLSKLDYASKECLKKWKLDHHMAQIHHLDITFIKDNIYFSIMIDLREQRTCSMVEEYKKLTSLVRAYLY